MHERLLQLVLRIFIDVFLVISDYGFGNGLANGIDLRSVTTTGNTDAYIDASEFVETNDEYGLVDLITMSMSQGVRGKLRAEKMVP